MRSAHDAPARAVALAALVSLLPAARPAELAAQYFGRNKVQYETFDFRVLHTDHFDVHYYPAESVATVDASRMAERWYDRYARTLQHSYARKPLIFYADHPDFQQTNTTGGFISQGTGGFTEPIRNRVVMPFTGVYADNDHVLGHELVHVFQYDIATNASTGNGLQGMNQLPLWLIEGMAEYLSVGREDPHTAMWLRDATLRNDLPTIKKLSTDPRYFPYRYGQAFWAYVGGTWGDGVITALYRTAVRGGWEPAVRRILGRTSDSLSKEWLASIRATYAPVMAGRAAPREAGTRVLARSGGKLGEMDVSPALSPDGRYVAFTTGRALFDVSLMVADVTTGDIVKRLTSPNVDQHFTALSYISSAGSWSPDARRLAFPVFDEGDNAIAIFNVGSRRVERTIRVRGVGAISDVSWGAGDRIALSGWSGGISDLYVLDVGSERVQRLTNDRYADLQPAWSPDGRTLAFVTDRAPGTDFDRLTYGPMQIALLDVGSGRVQVLSLFQNAKHINPQFTPDGGELYFISDREGFSDVYRVALGADGAPGQISQVTRLATGVSGITDLSPALSVARQSGRLVFSVFENAGNSLYRLDAAQAAGTPVTPTAGATAVAGILPPVEAVGSSLVTAYLRDPQPVAAPGQPARTTSYRPSLALEYLGAPTVGVGTSSFGTVIGGSVAAYFTDLLTDRVVGGAVQASGTVKDIGGQLFYLNQRRRWNWQVGGAHIPYLTGYAQVRDTTFTANGGVLVPALVYEQYLARIFLDQASASVQYPFSQTRRLELGGGYSHIGYDFEVQRLYATDFGEVIGERKESADAPPGFGYVQGTAALVGDYSSFGFTSPVAGGRYRFEAGPTFGQITMQTALADYRRYFLVRPITFAFRALHYGRYGKDAESDRLQPLFLGEETLVRGYSAGSFDASECRSSDTFRSCPAIQRLIGSRIGIASVELRIPLFGTEQFGLINLPYLPTEVSPFVDAGVAWSNDESPKFEFARRSAERVPVVSAGVSVRVNLLGYAVGEVYYAYPFQRPGKGAHFGFQLQPGW